jgi:glycosyltransferase involved in cell wall biosynthesis
MRLILDFRTKPNYGPVIDLVNSLSDKHDVFFLPNKRSQPQGLSKKVVVVNPEEIQTLSPDVVFSTYSTLPMIAYLKILYTVPVVNYMFIHMELREFFSTKFFSLPKGYKSGKILDLAAFCFPKSFSTPDRLIVPNQTTEQELSKLGYSKNKLVVLPWGLDLTKYESINSSNPTFSFKDDEYDTIVYAGPLTRMRFSNQIITAFSDVVKNNCNVRLLLLFRKDLWDHQMFEELLTMLRQLELNSKVSIILSTTHESYLSYVSDASVIILPYFSSGSVEVPPFTLLECMALARPVITSPSIVTCGIIENGENGYITSDFSSLAGLINRLLSNKKLAHQIGQKAKTTVKEKYNLINFSAKLSDILESCSHD